MFPISIIKRSLVILLVGLTSMLQANTVPTSTPSPANVVLQNDVCNLPAPAFLSVMAVGTNWAQLAWAPVFGAAQFHIITREVSTGNIVNVVQVSGASNSAVISPLPQVTLRSEIRSVCPNGDDGTDVTFSPEFDPIVIEVVTTGIMPSGNFIQDCQLVGTSHCPISDVVGVPVLFKVQHPDNPSQNFRWFTATKVAAGHVKITPDLNYKGNEQSGFKLDEDFDELYKFIYIYYAGVKVAHLTTSVTASQRDLFRSGSGWNNGAYQIWSYKLNNQGFVDPNDRSQNMMDWMNQRLSASPNPFNNTLNVQIPFATEENDVNISLYDLQGRLVIFEQAQGGAQIRTLSTEGLAPGLYILRVDTGDRSETIKVVKTQ